MKKIIAVLLTVAVLFSLSGCLIQVNGEKNRAIVIAVIDDTIEVTKGEFIDMYNTNMYQIYYFYAQYGITLSDEQIKTYKTDIFNSLVEQKVIEAEIAKRGFETNDEDREKAKEDYEDMIKEKADALKDDAGENTEGRDFDKEARDYYLDVLKENDFEDVDAYIEKTSEDYRRERFLKSLVSDITVTDDEVKAEYDSLLAEQKKTPTLKADVIVYEPSGVNYKYIKVSLTKDEKTAYAALTDDTEKAEYLKNTSYKRAQDYLARLNNGEDFDTVLKDANDYLVANCGVDEDDLKDQTEPIKYYNGLSSTGLGGTVDSDIIGLNDGELTDIIDVSDGNYVIAKCIDRFAANEKAYEVGNEVYDEIKESLLEEKQDAALEGTDDEPGKKDEIIAEHKVVKYLNRVLVDY